MPARDRLGWFRFAPRDWLTDEVVQQMTHDERGRYINVLAWLYLSKTPGIVPELQVAIWAGYSETEWVEHREVFAGAFKTRPDGTWVQRRVRLEESAARNRIEKRARAGRVGARARWSSVANASESHGQSDADTRTPRHDDTTTQAEAVIRPGLIAELQEEFPRCDVPLVAAKVTNVRRSKRFRDINLTLRRWVLAAEKGGFDRRTVATNTQTLEVLEEIERGRRARDETFNPEVAARAVAHVNALVGRGNADV